MRRRLCQWLRRPFVAFSPSLDSTSQLPEACEDIKIDIVGIQAPSGGYPQNTATDKLHVVGVYDAKSTKNTIDRQWLERTIGEAALGGSYIVTWKFKGCQCVYKSLHYAVEGEDRFKSSAVVLFYHNRPAHVPSTELSFFQHGLRKAIKNQREIELGTKSKQRVLSWSSLRQRAKDQHTGKHEGKQKSACRVEPSGGFNVGDDGLGDWELVGPELLPGVIEARLDLINKPPAHSGVENTIDRGEDPEITCEPRLGKDALLTQGPQRAKGDVKEKREDAGRVGLEPAVHSIPDDSHTREYVEGSHNISSVVQPSLVLRPPSNEDNRPAPTAGLSQPYPSHPSDFRSSTGGLGIRGHKRGQDTSLSSNGTAFWSSPGSDTRPTTVATSMTTVTTTASQSTIGGRSPTIDTWHPRHQVVYEDPRHPHSPNVYDDPKNPIHPASQQGDEPEESDEEPPFPPLDRISTSSSSHSKMEFPDNYWTWDKERKNYYHIDENEDGSKTTRWYPRDFM